MFEDWFIVD